MLIFALRLGAVISSAPALNRGPTQSSIVGTVDAKETTFGTLLNGRVQFRVPLFQRQYAWEKAQRERLWADILELYEQRRDGDTASQHFMGSIVTAPEPLGPNRPATHTLIDGQQRITTLSIMLAALRDHMGENEESERLDALYLTNQFPQEPTDTFKLLPTQRDRDEFNAILTGQLDTRTSPGMRSTYKYYRERLSREEDADGQELDPMMLEHTLLQGLGVVSITLGPSDNAFRVFESLNATGLSLRQIDLIRNLFMMKLSVEEAESLYPRVWLPMQELLGTNFDDFAHDYYLKSGVYLRADDTYNHAKKQLSDADEQAVTAALDDLAWFAERWQRIHVPTREPYAPLAEALASLNRFGSDTPYPFFLNLFAAREQNHTVTEEQFVEIVRMLEGFLIRRMFAGVPTHSLSRMFIRLWHQLPHDGNPVEEVRKALAEPSRRWPSDQRFREDFATYSLYVDSRPPQRRMVLDSLELTYEPRETVGVNNLEIEHIMPQTLTDAWRAALGDNAEDIHAHWLHTPGNLTLTAYNSELSNAAWPQKRERYAASNIAMTRMLAQLDDFGASEIQHRGEDLADRAVRRWPGPPS
jgi:hypothetical protein